MRQDTLSKMKSFFIPLTIHQIIMWPANVHAYIHLPALVLPVSVALFVTAHSSMSVSPVSSAHTFTDASFSATLLEVVTIWTATFDTAIQATIL